MCFTFTCFNFTVQFLKSLFFNFPPAYKLVILKYSSFKTHGNCSCWILIKMSLQYITECRQWRVSFMNPVWGFLQILKQKATNCNSYSVIYITIFHWSITDHLTVNTHNKSTGTVITHSFPPLPPDWLKCQVRRLWLAVGSVSNARSDLMWPW